MSDRKTEKSAFILKLFTKIEIYEGRTVASDEIYSQIKSLLLRLISNTIPTLFCLDYYSSENFSLQ